MAEFFARMSGDDGKDIPALSACCFLSAGNTSLLLATTPCLEKMCDFYVSNNSVKHWPILTTTQHHEETSLN